jgi:carboxyl-terminal processing protease
MKKMRKFLLIGVLVITSLALVGFVRNPDIYFLIKKNFTIFSEVYREVSLHYVDEINPEKLMRKGINAMLESLDPYTVMIDEAEKQNMEIMTRGSYGGVGLNVGYRGGKIVVIAPMEGYSAHQKGIRSGDVIVEVNGVKVDDMTPEEVQNLTTGEPDTQVTLTIERYGIDHPISFELERQRIEVNNIAYSGFVGESQDIGYILLNRFSQNTAQEIRQALEDLRSEKEFSGLVLDLRNNPGGLLDEAVATVDKFVPQEQLVVETRGRLSQHNNVFETEETPVAPELPLVILQNGGSASASEIVAGALQDLDRAVVMGEQSFGKGLVQIVRPLSYNTSLKLTASRYFIPSGRSIQSVRYTHDDTNSAVSKPDSMRKAFKTRNGRTVYDSDGIVPDVKVSAQKPSLLQTSLMQKNLFFEFANQFAADHDSLTEHMGSDQLYNQFQTFVDKQDFQYETPSERYLAKIDSSLDETSANSEAHIEALQRSIEKHKHQAFAEERAELEKILYLELIARYRGQKGQTEASLPFDPFVTEASDLFQDVNRYKDILSVSN